MKIFSYLAVAVLVALTADSCATGDEEPVHTNNTILSIQITPYDTNVPAINGVIDEDNHRILFPIPRDMHELYPDLTRLYVRATVGYDAMISPVLTGLQDLSEPHLITVTAQNGATRQYTLQAYKSKEGGDDE